MPSRWAALFTPFGDRLLEAVAQGDVTKIIGLQAAIRSVHITSHPLPTAVALGQPRAGAHVQVRGVCGLVADVMLVYVYVRFLGARVCVSCRVCVGGGRFNGGGHINHSIFWENLAPASKGGGGEPTGETRTRVHRGLVLSVYSDTRTLPVAFRRASGIGIEPTRTPTSLSPCARVALPPR